MFPAPKRLRVAPSAACSQCRSAKKRCEGGVPCSSCKRRGLPCTSADAAAEQDAEQQQSELKYRLDVHVSLYNSTAALLDRYFYLIAPLWEIVLPSDLRYRPFASPVLIRAICLVSAMSFPELDTKIVGELSELVLQCFDAEDLLTFPCVSTLQALLLLLACPNLKQRSMVVTSALRMASLLGFDRVQSTRPILYWSCVAWVRWEALKNRQQDLTGMPYVHPARQPSLDSFFGHMYHLLEQAGTESSPAFEVGSYAPPGLQACLHRMEAHLLNCPAGDHRPVRQIDDEAIWRRYVPFCEI